MEIRKGYKQTEVGVIPVDWKLKTIGEICQIFGRIGFRGYTVNDIVGKEQGAITISPSNIQNDKMNFSKCTYVSWFKYEESPEIKIFNGDILLVKTGSTYGKTAIIKDLNEKATINPQIVVLKKITADNFFLGYVMSHEVVQNQIKTTIVGGAIPTLSQKQVAGFKVPFPPTKSEQSAIATVLSDTDALISGLEKLIDKKKSIKQGTMQELLTGKKRLPGFKGEWETKRLGEIGEISGAGVDKKSKPDEIPVRLLNYMDVYKRDFIYSRELNHWVTAPSHQLTRCAVRKGDIFFTPSSEMRWDIGISAVAMEDMPDVTYSYHVDRLRLFDNWDIKFRAYIFKTKSFLDQCETVCEGSGKRYVISLSKFRSLTIKYPKDFEEQAAIAQILSDMDAEIEALEQKLEKYKKIKQGMMQELLTGRIRLTEKLKKD